MNRAFADIPKYNMKNFRQIHRQHSGGSAFGHNQQDVSKLVNGFEIYSGEGMVPSKGPLKSEFYRMSITVNGTLDMCIGLYEYSHRPGTLAFTYPNQVFSTNNVSADAAGYYLFFTADFLNDIIPSVKIANEFPFYDISGRPVFQIGIEEMEKILNLVENINVEIQQHKPDRDKAIKMYLYLLLLESKRSYLRQNIGNEAPLNSDNFKLLTRFKKSVALNYLHKRQVKEYAQMLGVSANHLNKVVKENMGRTASDVIKETILQEAKSLLLYTDNSVAEIAYRLNFSDPASFSRFFKTATSETALVYRSRIH